MCCLGSGSSPLLLAIRLQAFKFLEFSREDSRHNSVCDALMTSGNLSFIVTCEQVSMGTGSKRCLADAGWFDKIHTREQGLALWRSSPLEPMLCRELGPHDEPIFSSVAYSRA